MSTEARTSTSSSVRVRLGDGGRLAILAAVALGLAALFLTVGASGMWEYALPRRATKLAAIALAGCAVASSTVVFQALTNNRILSPSIMGLDSLYLLVQTAIVYAFGSTHPLVQSANTNFALSLLLMLVFSFVMYRLFFAGERGNIFFMLLLGIIFGTFFQSIASFMQVLIDPNEFLIVQGRMFASFNNIKTPLLTASAVAMLLTAVVFWPQLKFLDVLALGKEHAINLGIDYDRVVRRLLMAVFMLVAVSTALVGPITFLGLIVANVAYELVRTYRRLWAIAGACLVACVALIGGQLVVEHVFNFSTNISVIINLAGGIYFLYLIVKERTSW